MCLHAHKTISGGTHKKLIITNAFVEKNKTGEQGMGEGDFPISVSRFLIFDPYKCIN